MPKNEVTKLTEQELMLQKEGLLDEPDDYTPAPKFPQVKIEIDKKRAGKDSEFFLKDDDEITDLGNKLIASPLYAQKTRAYFLKDEDMPLCSSVEGVPIGAESLAKDCRSCEHGVFGSACKAKVRLFCRINVDGKWIIAVLSLPPTSIKNWDRYTRKLKKNKPRSLKYWWTSATITMEHHTKGKNEWEEMLWGDAELLPVEILKTAIEARKQVMPYTAVVDGSDFQEPGDRPGATVIKDFKPYDNSHGEIPLNEQPKYPKSGRKADDSGKTANIPF